MAERLRTTIYANRYKALDRIGKGSFGKVYLCQDLENVQVRRVLKKIRLSSEKVLENATREARIICVLEHPGVLNYFDHLQDKKRFIVVTEYCEGGDLKSAINHKKHRNGSFEIKEVQHMTVQLAMALEYIHSHGIIHRDIKPENVFLSKGVLKIGDFGVSRVLQTSVVTKTFVGTQNYMAPEMISGEGYNSKADVWSLGCIVYELCTLDLAFPRERGLFARIILGPLPVLPSSIDSSTLSYIVKWTLERDVHTRMSASEVAQYCIDNGFITNMMDSHLKKKFLKKRKMRRPEISRKRQELAEKTEPKERERSKGCSSSSSQNLEDSGLGRSLPMPSRADSKKDKGKEQDGPTPSSCRAEGSGGRNYPLKSGTTSSSSKADVSGKHNRNLEDSRGGNKTSKTTVRRYEQPKLSKTAPAELGKGSKADAKYSRNSQDSGIESYSSKSTAQRHEWPKLSIAAPAKLEEGFDDDDGMPSTPSEADNFYKSDFESTDDDDDVQDFGGSASADDENDIQSLGGSAADDDAIQSLGGSAADDDDIQSLGGSAFDPDNSDILQDIGWSLGLDEKIKSIESLKMLSKEAMGEKEFDKAHNSFTRVLKEQSAKGDTKQSTVQLAVESLDPPPDSFMLLLFVEQKLFLKIE